MKYQALIGSLLGLAAGTAAIGQEVTPVWVQHINGLVNVAPENKLPILVKAGGTGDATYGFSGNDVVDSYVSFVKYDDDHYLLGVRENGINETDPNLTDEQKANAAAFPDRSLVWIDAKTGKSLGLALKTEVLPVPIATQSTVYAWWKFGVQDGANGERAVYTGYKYKVLRYAPSGTVADPNFPAGRPTWAATPTQAWVEPVPGEPSGDESSGGDGSASWRWKAFRVSGAGNQTQLWIGGGTWRASHQPQQFETTDGGLTFQPIARMDDRDSGGEKGAYALGGQPSSISATPTDPARPGLQVSYQGHYPGSGWEARPNRYTMNPQGDGTAPRLGGTGRPGFFDRDEAAGGNLPAFRWEAAGKDGIPIDHKVDGVEYYDGNWVLTMDTKDGLEYVVSYAIPSWNQQFGAVGNPDAVFKPGWIGVHTLDGQIASGVSAYKIPVYETDEPIVDPNGNGGTGHDYVYEGDITVYPVAGGGSDIRQVPRPLVGWQLRIRRLPGGKHPRRHRVGPVRDRGFRKPRSHSVRDGLRQPEQVPVDAQRRGSCRDQRELPRLAQRRRQQGDPDHPLGAGGRFRQLRPQDPESPGRPRHHPGHADGGVGLHPAESAIRPGRQIAFDQLRDRRILGACDP